MSVRVALGRQGSPDPPTPSNHASQRQQHQRQKVRCGYSQLAMTSVIDAAGHGTDTPMLQIG